MTEPLPEPPPPETSHPARDPELESARRNVLLGVGLFALVVAIFVGTVVVAVVYLTLD